MIQNDDWFDYIEQFIKSDKTEGSYVIAFSPEFFTKVPAKELDSDEMIKIKKAYTDCMLTFDRTRACFEDLFGKPLVKKSVTEGFKKIALTKSEKQSVFFSLFKAEEFRLGVLFCQDENNGHFEVRLSICRVAKI